MMEVADRVATVTAFPRVSLQLVFHVCKKNNNNNN